MTPRFMSNCWLILVLRREAKGGFRKGINPGEYTKKVTSKLMRSEGPSKDNSETSTSSRKPKS